MSNFEDVKTFMITYGQEVKNKASFPDKKIVQLRYNLIKEELDELSVAIENNTIRISIKFISEQFKNNDETTIIKKQDLWTFEKSIDSKDPNWLLSST